MVEDGAVHRHDERVLRHLGVGVVHALADAAQLAEEGVGEQLRDDQLPALGRDAVNLHRALAQEEERLARLARRVDDAAARERAQVRDARHLAHLLLGETLKEVGRRARVVSGG
jgi:hypothetical protein